MTNEEFLDFDVNLFNQEGYENERTYMGAITAYFVACVNETSNNYEYAKLHNKAVQPNKWSGWYKYDKTLRDLISPARAGVINPAHKKANEFLKRYEQLCKRYLSAYDKQYADIADSVATKEKYYTANICDKLTSSIYRKTQEEAIDIDQIIQAGFVDLRLPFCFSLDEKGKFVQNEYSDEMEAQYDSLDQTLTQLVCGIGEPIATDSKPRTKA